MPTYYWDPQNGSNSNNGLGVGSPVQSWNATAIGSGTFAPGDTLLLKAGAVYDAAAGGRLQPVMSSQPTQALPFRISTYGDPNVRGVIECGGTRDIGVRLNPIDASSGVPTRWVTIENLEIRNFTTSGISIADLANTGVENSFCSVINCYIHHGTSTSAAGIDLRGQGITVRGNIVEDVNADGILFRGAGYCGYNLIRRVSASGGGNGDGIQIDGGISSVPTGTIVEYNDITKENSDKQGMLVTCDDAIIRYNVIRGLSVGAGLLTVGGDSLTLQTSGNQIYGNLLIGTDGIHILNADGPHSVYSNVIIGTNSAETEQNSTGIDVGVAGGGSYANNLIYNNTVIGHQRGINCRNNTVRNNLVVNCGGKGYDLTNAASSESYNCAWNNGTNFTTTPGTGSIVADPMLDVRYKPTNLRLASAGTNVSGTDFYGDTFRGNTVGAVNMGYNGFPAIQKTTDTIGNAESFMGGERKKKKRKTP